MKKWIVSDLNKENANRIARQFGLPALPAMLMDIMKFDDTEIEEFISDEYDFADPFLITDMELAVERIAKAIENFEKICIYGDYDADGVTSTALLYSYLVGIESNVMYYIPSRESEGYGLNNSAIDYLHEQNVNLIVTVDNGISAYEQVEYANSLGIDVVITDHHTPPEKLPNAVAVVDPHRADDISDFKHFSGVGVAFKLIMALEDAELDIDDLVDRYSDIIAMGTIGDIVSLTGENRFLVKEGLKRINSNSRLGIQALRKNAGSENKQLSSGNISFSLVPRINAVGRLSLSEKSVKLLLTDDEEEAESIAEELGNENRERQRIEKEILASVDETLQKDESIKYRKIIVVAGEGWHQGVIGIVAARIKDKYGKPTIIISYEGENAKGSARSVEGFVMCDGVAYCKDLLTIYGGHPMAAGMSLPTANIDAFREKINEYAESITTPFFPVLKLVCKLNPATISVPTVEGLSILEPYGAGNPTPIFGIYDLALLDIIPMGGGKHLRLKFHRKNIEVTANYFFKTPEEFPYQKGDLVNIAVTLEINLYNNVKSVSMSIKEMTFKNADNEKLLESNAIFDDLMIGKPVTDEMRKELSPTRDECAVVYRFLVKNKGFRYSSDILHYRISHPNISLGKLRVILQALKEHNLITMNNSPEFLNIRVVENPEKVNLLSAPILQALL